MNQILVNKHPRESKTRHVRDGTQAGAIESHPQKITSVFLFLVCFNLLVSMLGLKKKSRELNENAHKK